METYRHSGAISPAGILLASTLGIVTAVVLGVVYSIGVVYIPIVQINGLLTCAFGCLMGLAVGWGAKVGKIRNPFVATAYGFVVGWIGLYVAWGTDLLVRFGLPPGDKILSAYHPDVLARYIELFYKNGFWGMTKGEIMSGIPLAIVWALEAAIIVVGSTALARQFILHVPFCEGCGRWTATKPVARQLSLVGAGETLNRLLAGDLTALAEFNLAQNETPYLQLDMARCSSCTESCYLTVQQVTLSLDKEGKLKTEKTPLLRNMHVAAEDLPLVENAGREPVQLEDSETKPEGETPPETA